MTTIQRMKKRTPKFFQHVRNIGLALAAAGTAIVSAPLILPDILTHIAGYVAVAGGVMTAVSQTAVLHEKK